VFILRYTCKRGRNSAANLNKLSSYYCQERVLSAARIVQQGPDAATTHIFRMHSKTDGFNIALIMFIAKSRTRQIAANYIDKFDPQMLQLE